MKDIEIIREAFTRVLPEDCPPVEYGTCCGKSLMVEYLDQNSEEEATEILFDKNGGFLGFKLHNQERGIKF